MPTAREPDPSVLHNDLGRFLGATVSAGIIAVVLEAVRDLGYIVVPGGDRLTPAERQVLLMAAAIHLGTLETAKRYPPKDQVPVDKAALLSAARKLNL